MKKVLKLCSLILALAVFASVTAVPTFADDAEFKDVNEADYFYEAAVWGAGAGITQGVGEGLFDPDGEVSRAQVVTFLWRMANEPASQNPASFKDVEEGVWYGKAVDWAVENDITKGTSEDTFSPDTVCDRAMCLTLLYRLVGSPLDGIDFSALTEPSDVLEEGMTEEDFATILLKDVVAKVRENGLFSDVSNDAYYELPVIWGLLNGIITVENTGNLEEGASFRSNEPCVRKEMISFLYQTKLMQDEADEPVKLYSGLVTLPVPLKYFEALAIDMDVSSDDEDGVLATVSELASKEAAQASGDETDGIGELFKIVRISEDTLKDLLCSDMLGAQVFAKDENGKYYMFDRPTDVRFMRETTEKMTEDQDIWTELNEWASGEIDEILKYSDELIPVTFTNTMLDMYLSRIAYKDDIKYTVSTTEFGPIEPKSFDAKEYAEFLIWGNFKEDEDAEAPDGEYVVLDFPEEGVRYDFFKADGNLVREVRDDYTCFYRRASADEDMSNTDIMQSWYDELAKKAGKKK